MALVNDCMKFSPELIKKKEIITILGIKLSIMGWGKHAGISLELPKNTSNSHLTQAIKLKKAKSALKQYIENKKPC